MKKICAAIAFTAAAMAISSQSFATSILSNSPVGVFVSDPALIDAPESVIPAAASGKNIFIRLKDIHPAEGRFNYDLLTVKIAAFKAANPGKRYSIQIVGGTSSPDYLLKNAVTMIDSSGNLIKVPNICRFDMGERWEAIMNSIGQTLDGDPDLALIHAPQFSVDGITPELKFAANQDKNFNAAAYTFEYNKLLQKIVNWSADFRMSRHVLAFEPIIPSSIVSDNSLTNTKRNLTAQATLSESALKAAPAVISAMAANPWQYTGRATSADGARKLFEKFKTFYIEVPTANFLLEEGKFIELTEAQVLTYPSPPKFNISETVISNTTVTTTPWIHSFFNMNRPIEKGEKMLISSTASPGYTDGTNIVKPGYRYFGYDSPLKEGINYLYAKVVNEAGKVTGESYGRIGTLDTTAPGNIPASVMVWQYKKTNELGQVFVTWNKPIRSEYDGAAFTASVSWDGGRTYADLPYDTAPNESLIPSSVMKGKAITNIPSLLVRLRDNKGNQGKPMTINPAIIKVVQK